MSMALESPNQIFCKIYFVHLLSLNCCLIYVLRPCMCFWVRHCKAAGNSSCTSFFWINFEFSHISFAKNSFFRFPYSFCNVTSRARPPLCAVCDEVIVSGFSFPDNWERVYAWLNRLNVDAERRRAIETSIAISKGGIVHLCRRHFVECDICNFSFDAEVLPSENCVIAQGLLFFNLLEGSSFLVWKCLDFLILEKREREWEEACRRQVQDHWA